MHGDQAAFCKFGKFSASFRENILTCNQVTMVTDHMDNDQTTKTFSTLGRKYQQLGWLFQAEKLDLNCQYYWCKNPNI